MADIIAEKVFKHPVFTWGAANLVRGSDARAAYLSAIEQADKGDIEPLIKFARS